MEETTREPRFLIRCRQCGTKIGFDIIPDDRIDLCDNCEEGR